jgi:hypothetical protein
VKNTLMTIAQMCEAKRFPSQDLVALLLRGVLLDMEAAPHVIPLLPPPDTKDDEIARLERLLDIRAAEIARLKADLAERVGDCDALMRNIAGLKDDRRAASQEHERVVVALATAKATNQDMLRRMDQLVAELDVLRAENHALKQTATPATPEAMETLERALADGSEHMPVDDESADMGIAEQPRRAKKGKPGRPHPPRKVHKLQHGDQTWDVYLPCSQSQMFDALQQQARTTRELIDLGFGAKLNIIGALIGNLKQQITAQTNGEWGLHRVGDHYTIARLKDVQSPKAYEATKRAIVVPAQRPEPPILPKQPIPIVYGPIEVPEGALIAVDVKTRRVATPKGVYLTDSVACARILQALSGLKDGQMHGTAHLAAKADLKSGEVARLMLLSEADRLKRHGVDLAWFGRDNVRLVQSEPVS